MSIDAPRELRYEPRYCTLRHDTVWAIVAKQANGSRRIVNCLDKDQACFGTNCAFTTDCGEWPFGDAPAMLDQPVAEVPREGSD